MSGAFEVEACHGTCTFVRVQVYVHDVIYVCVCVCVCMCLYVLMTQRMRKCVCSDPRAGCKFLLIKIVPPAHPSVKRVPGLVLGSKVHWLCLADH